MNKVSSLSSRSSQFSEQSEVVSRAENDLLNIPSDSRQLRVLFSIYFSFSYLWEFSG